MNDKVTDFLRDEQGLTTVEYAMAGALVAASLVLAFTNLGTALASLISSVESAIVP